MKKLSEMHGSERRKRIAELLRNPGTRKYVPTQDLPANLRAKRDLNTRLNTEFVPGSGITYRDVARDRDAATTLKYAPAESQLAGQVRDSQAFEREQIPAYFAQYQQMLRDAEAQSRDNTAFAVGQVGALEQGLAKTSAAEQAKVNDAMRADAAKRGATYNEAGANDVAQRASTARSALTTGFGAMLASQGANNVQRLINEVPISHLRQGVEQANERGQRRKLTDQQLELAREKGAFGTQYLRDRAEAEQKAALERQVFGADVADKAADNARQARQDATNRYDKAQGRKIARHRETLAEKRIRLDEEKDQYQRENRLGPYKPAAAPKGETPAQRRARQEKAEKARTTIQTARDTAQSMLAQRVEDPPKSGKFRHPTEQEVRTALLEKFKDSVVVNAAMELRKRGRLNPGTADHLKHRGVGVPKDWQTKPGNAITGATGTAISRVLG